MQSSSALEEYLRQGSIENVRNMLHKRTSVIPWDQTAIKPDISTLEMASNLYPKEKNLILCIVMHLDFNVQDIDRIYVQACKLASTKNCDILIPLTILSRIDEEMNQTFKFDSKIFESIASRTDIRPKAMRAWFNIFHVAFPQIPVGDGKSWVRWMSMPDINITQEKKDIIFAWRMDLDECDKKRVERNSVSRPIKVTKEEDKKENERIDRNFDVYDLEYQRDIERGCDPEEAKLSIEEHKKCNDKNHLASRPVWGFDDNLQELPSDLQNFDDDSQNIKRIRWALGNKIYRPQCDNYDNNARFYLSNVHSWLPLIPCQENLDQLLKDYSSIITSEMLMLGTEKHVKWLIAQDRFEEAKIIMSSIPNKSLSFYRRIFDIVAYSTSIEVEDFALEMLYDHPEVLSYIQGDLCPGYNQAQWQASSLLYLTMISEGMHDSNGEKLGCFPFIDGTRIPTCNYFRFYPMEFEERWAMIQVLRMHFQQSSNEFWYDKIMTVNPSTEIPFWLEWSITRRFPKNTNASTCKLSVHGNKYIKWFANNYFGPPDLRIIFRHTPYQQSVELLKEFLMYWPHCLSRQSRQVDFIFYAISLRNVEMLRYLHKEHKLTLMEQDMKKVFHTLFHPVIECRNLKKCDESLHPDMIENHRQTLEWVFTTFEHKISLFYEQEELSRWIKEYIKFDSNDTSVAMCKDQVDTCKWVQDNCLAAVSFNKRLSEFIIKEKEHQEAKRRENQTKVCIRTYEDSDYDDYDGDD